MLPFELKTDLQLFGEASSQFRVESRFTIKHMDVLRLDFAVRGRVDHLIVPPPSPSPSRTDNLWKHTCFECFISPKDSDEYIELNFSPSGDWALYAFKGGEREGMKDFGEDTWIKVFSKLNPDSLELQATIKWEALLRKLKWPPTVEASSTAVIETTGNVLSYWATRHTRPKPDFHARESFVLTLESPKNVQKDFYWPRKPA